MALVRTRSPWSALADLQREFDHLIANAFGTPMTHLGRRSGTWAPAVDVFTREGDVVVRAELPGIDPDKDVDIAVADGMLRIRGERKAEHRDEGDGWYRIESSYGAFERSFPLPESVDADDITATYRQGILEVVVPGAAQVPAAKKVPVQIERGEQQAIGTGQDQAAAEEAQA